MMQIRGNRLMDGYLYYSRSLRGRRSVEEACHHTCISYAQGKGESILELLLHTKVPNLDSGICAACRNTHSIGVKVHVMHWPAGNRLRSHIFRTSRSYFTLCGHRTCEHMNAVRGPIDERFYRLLQKGSCLLCC
jgi:hypothetical protein